jgi:hypothetical protein
LEYFENCFLERNKKDKERVSIYYISVLDKNSIDKLIEKILKKLIVKKDLLSTTDL